MSVTTASLTQGRKLPRRGALAWALAVSLALNVCVVAGVVWSRVHAAPVTATEHFRRLEDQLDLTPQQRAAFDDYVAGMAARAERMRQAVEPAMDGAWAEMSKPDPDAARVLQALDNAADLRRGFQHEAVTATLTLLAALTPDQRAKFVADQHERFAAMRRRHAEESR